MLLAFNTSSLTIKAVHPGYMTRFQREVAQRDCDARCDEIAQLYAKFFDVDQFRFVYPVVIWKGRGRNKWSMVLPRMIVEI
jgi:hypothetical protein